MVGFDVGAANVKAFTGLRIAKRTLHLDCPSLIWPGLQNQVNLGSDRGAIKPRLSVGWDRAQDVSMSIPSQLDPTIGCPN